MMGVSSSPPLLEGFKAIADGLSRTFWNLQSGDHRERDPGGSIGLRQVSSHGLIPDTTSQRSRSGGATH
jgi:hypothetical protein